MKISIDGAAAVAPESLSPADLVTVLEEVAAILAGCTAPQEGGTVTQVAGQAAMAIGRRLAKVTDLLEAGLVGVVQTVQASGAIRASCYKSVKGWMTATFRCFGNAAGQRTMLAKELRRLSNTGKALAAGDVSADQARAITRTTGPMPAEPAAGVEAQLLELAKLGAGADEVARTGHMAAFLHDPKGAIERARQLQDRRAVRLWWDQRTGALKGSLQLPPEVGARLQHSLEQLAQRAGADDHRTIAQRNADALTALLDGATGTELIIWASADTVADPTSTIPGQLRPSGMPIPAIDVRRLAASGSTTLRLLATTGSGLPADIGRRVRAWTDAQRRLIQTRDQQCITDGCTIPAEYCQIDHLRPWEDHGPTDINNGACLCSHHNRDKAAHPDRYHLLITDGRPRYLISKPVH